MWYMFIKLVRPVYYAGYGSNEIGYNYTVQAFEQFCKKQSCDNFYRSHDDQFIKICLGVVRYIQRHTGKPVERIGDCQYHE